MSSFSGSITHGIDRARASEGNEPGFLQKVKRRSQPLWKEVLVAATGIQNVMAHAGVAQASNDGKGMQVYEGRRIPLIYWDPSGEDYRRLRLSSRPIPIPGNTDSWTVLQVLP